MTPVLEVENLSKTYGKTTAVDNISFTVHEGEIVGLLGPNGAGKSSTIQMILGLIKPSSGSIRIFGKDLEQNRNELLQRMNFASPYAFLPYNLSTYENLKIFGLLYGLKGSSDRAKELLKEFDLEKFQKQRTGKLSSGEQTRLQLAKAFLNNPKLLLLDEPTSSLDPVVARGLRQQIADRVNRVKGAVLWTSHNMREVETMCDRIIFLSHGKVVANDTPANMHK